MTMPGRITILHVPDCPLVARVTTLLEECMQAADVRLPVEQVVGEFPSPTLIIDEVDVATGHPHAGSASCRLDLPTREQICSALERLSSR